MLHQTVVLERGLSSASFKPNSAGYFTANNPWSIGADPPLVYDFDYVWWYKKTADCPASNSNNSSATTTLWLGWSQYGLAFTFFRDGYTSYLSWACRTGHGALLVDDMSTYTINMFDGNWHLIGGKITCDGSQNQTLSHYIDGVHQQDSTLTAVSGDKVGLAAEFEGFYIGGEADYYIGNAGGFDWQHLAIFPGGRNATNGLQAADFATLYAAR